MTTEPGREGLRVLVLSKRQYMARDLLDDRYGRFRELPLALAARGAQVRGVCLSYRARSEVELVDAAAHAAVRWRSLSGARLWRPGAGGYLRQVLGFAQELRPNVVWACSDVLHAVLGGAVARRLGAKLAIDLYDNYEGYPAARLPGVTAALRRAVRGADAVSCISEPLRRKVQEDYGFSGPTLVLGNAIPEGSFAPGDRAAARQRFGLPSGAFIVGTAGALAQGRGTDLLLAAFARLAPEWPELHLVLAGPNDGSVRIPAHPRLHALGLLPADAVPALLPAFDVSVVGNRDSEFGRYCFPQKLYESLACQVPVAVARVGAMAELLRPWPDCLYGPDSVEELVQVLRGLRARPFVPPLPVPSWATLAASLDDFLRELAAR
jgi:glycosyltransferase involved in cell wall biosynthesis